MTPSASILLDGARHMLIFQQVADEKVHIKLLDESGKLINETHEVLPDFKRAMNLVTGSN